MDVVEGVDGIVGDGERVVVVGGGAKRRRRGVYVGAICVGIGVIGVVYWEDYGVV